MTLADIQKQISARYDISGTSISNTSNEYIRRTTLINIALRKWADEVFWTELTKSATVNVVGNQNYVDLPADVDRQNIMLDTTGYIKIGDYYYKKLNSHEQLNTDATTDRVVWIQNTSDRMYIQPAPTENGTFTLTYKTTYLAVDTNDLDIAELTADTDTPKIGDTDYLVNWTLAELYLTNDETAKSQFYRLESDKDLQKMIYNNTMQTPYQQKTRVQSMGYDVEVIGEYDF